MICGDDLEQRALACHTLARCIIASGHQSPECLREALTFLNIAEQDYKKIQILRSLADVQYLVSVLYHNLSLEGERDEAAKRHLETEEQRKCASIVVHEHWIGHVWDLVCDVGATLAGR